MTNRARIAADSASTMVDLFTIIGIGGAWSGPIHEEGHRLNSRRIELSCGKNMLTHPEGQGRVILFERS